MITPPNIGVITVNSCPYTPVVSDHLPTMVISFQLAGHSDSFLQGATPGTVLKHAGSQEELCYRLVGLGWLGLDYYFG